MKKILLALAIALIQMITFAQAPAIEWQKALGGTSNEQANSVQPTPDGGYIVSGYTTSSDGDVTGYHGGSSLCGSFGQYYCPNNDAWIMKLDATGAVVWQKAMGGTGIDSAQSILPTSDGGYIMVGNAKSNNGDLSGINLGGEAWIVKLDATGTIVWQKLLAGYGPSGSGNARAYSIQSTPDGGYYVAGMITPYYTNRWVAKINSSGSIQWQNSYAGTSYDYLFSIQTTADNGYITAGQTNSNIPGQAGTVIGYHGNGDAYVGKVGMFDTDIHWEKALGGTSTDQANSIQSTSDGGYIMAGYTYSTDGDVTGNHGGQDAWVVKLSATGDLVWQKTLGGTGSDLANSIQSTSDGGYLVAGSTSSNNGDVTVNHGGSDAWIVKLDATGSPLWQKTIGGTNSDNATSIQLASDGGYIVGGYTSSNDGDVTGNHGGGDAWVIKIGSELSTSNFSVHDELKLYPNPAKSIVYLQTATNASMDKIKITDLSGKVILIQTINTTQVNIEPLASGLYIIEAFSGVEKYMSKFIKE
jgi:hypothetical protein